MKEQTLFLCVLGFGILLTVSMAAMESHAVPKSTDVKVQVYSVETVADDKYKWDPQFIHYDTLGNPIYTDSRLAPDFQYYITMHDDISKTQIGGNAQSGGEVSDSYKATWNKIEAFRASMEFGNYYYFQIQVKENDGGGSFERADVNPDLIEVTMYVRFDIAKDRFQIRVAGNQYGTWHNYGFDASATGDGNNGDYHRAIIHLSVTWDSRGDTTAPVAEVVQDPPKPTVPRWNGWYTQEVSLSLTVKSDDQWDTSRCYFCITKNAKAPKPTWVGPFYLTWSNDTGILLAKGQGTVDLACRVYDGSGHGSICFNETLRVDTANPSINSLTGPTGYINTPQVTFSWSGGDIQISGGGPPSGFKEYRYAIDTNVPGAMMANTTQGTTVSLTTPTVDGAHTFYLEIVDKAGNSARGSYTFNVDTTPPPTGRLDGPIGWVTGPYVHFTWVGLPGDDNVDHYNYKMDDGPEAVADKTTTEKTFETPSNGVHTFSIQLVDTAGNKGAWSSFEFKVDREMPAVSKLAGPQGWVNTTIVHFSWNGVDTFSGIKKYNCFLDDEPLDPTTSAAIDLDDVTEGSHTLRVEPEDNAGNLGDPVIVEFKVDRTAPRMIELTCRDEWVSEATVTFDWDGDDAAGAEYSSGIDHFIYVVDNGAEHSGTSPLEIDTPADGEHTLEVKAKDSAGNTGDFITVKFKVDRTAPTVKNLVGPKNWVLPTGISFQWEGDDTGGATPSSGVDYYAYVLDDGDELTCTIPLELSDVSDGEHTLKVKAVDIAGNVGTFKSTTFKVDSTPPEMTSVTAPTDWITGNKMTVTCVATDASSGLDHYVYKIDEGTEDEVTSQFSIDTPADGTHTISVKAVDLVGNIGEAMTAEFKVDKSSPKVQSATLQSGSMRTKTRDVTLVVELKDDKDGSKIKNIRYKIGNGVWTEVLMEEEMTSGTVNIAMTLPNKEGKTDVLLKSEDLAGNVGAEYTANINYAPEKKASMLPIILIIIVVLVVMLLLFMRTDRGRALMTRSSTPKSQMGTGSGQFGGSQVGRMAGPSIAAPPSRPMAPVAPVATTAAMGTTSGTFRALNVKTQCPTCGTSIDRGTSAFVCSCGTAIHEQCAGRTKVCPGCKKEIRF